MTTIEKPKLKNDLKLKTKTGIEIKEPKLYRLVLVMDKLNGEAKFPPSICHDCFPEILLYIANNHSLIKTASEIYKELSTQYKSEITKPLSLDIAKSLQKLIQDVFSSYNENHSKKSKLSVELLEV